LFYTAQFKYASHNILNVSLLLKKMLKASTTKHRLSRECIQK
jgi:hypothetical protein